MRPVFTIVPVGNLGVVEGNDCTVAGAFVDGRLIQGCCPLAFLPALVEEPTEGAG